MALKSTFTSDLKKEQQLTALLNTYYHKHLNHYSFERIQDKKRQLEGIDLILTHKETGLSYLVDEKAQLDYINEDLPTFAFELSYKKARIIKKGWFFDKTKKTEFYSLITGIYSDAPSTYTSCKITIVNRNKLIDFLKEKGINESLLTIYVNKHATTHGKLRLRELNPRTEGYLYMSTKNKAEKPVNLIFQLSFLIENKLVKRLI